MDSSIQGISWSFLGFQIKKESGSIKKKLINEQRMYFLFFHIFVNNIFLDETRSNGENIFQFLGRPSACYSRLVKITCYFVVQVRKFNKIF